MDANLSKQFDLTGHRALVTGASGGIGAAIAGVLAKAGADIIIHFRQNEQSAREQITKIGSGKTIEADIGSEAGAKALVDKLAADGDLPDLLVNNAGLQTLGSIGQASEQDWQDINNINLGGIYGLTKHLSNALIAAEKPGAIVNIASIEGLDPAQDHSHYAASKAGVIMFTKASALELGQHNIRVNCVSPGLIERPDIEEQWPEGVWRWRDRAPLTRLGRGEDIANAVHFLLSPAALWVSGANLVVDGGMSTQNRW